MGPPRRVLPREIPCGGGAIERRAWKTTCVVGLQSQSDQGIGALREESEPIETTGLVLVADLGLA
jgi:hypothetical protein